MLPLRDINPTLRRPVVTYALIAANLGVFLYQVLMLAPSQSETFVAQHGVIPAFLLSGYGPSLSTPFTSMFMHGGFAHLVGNLWFLHIFGDNVEDTLGRGRFLAFYVACGVAAVIAHALTDTSSTTPMLGASGAISGVLGAYLIMYPRARVVTFAFIFVFELPAAFFILAWFIPDLLSGVASLGTSRAGGGVAFFAHIGGFVAGVLIVLATGVHRRRPLVTVGPRYGQRR